MVWLGFQCSAKTFGRGAVLLLGLQRASEQVAGFDILGSKPHRLPKRTLGCRVFVQSKVRTPEKQVSALVVGMLGGDLLEEGQPLANLALKEEPLSASETSVSAGLEIMDLLHERIRPRRIIG